MKKQRRKRERKPVVVKAVPVRRVESDPFGGPFDFFTGFQERMNQFFNFPFPGETSKELRKKKIFPLKADVYGDGRALVVKAELPGLKKDEVSVSISGDNLIIKGERKQAREAKREDFYRRELSYGSFQRRFALPSRVKAQDVKVKYENGILELRIPKVKGEKAKAVDIKVE